MFTRNELDLLYKLAYRELRKQRIEVLRYKKEENIDSVKLSKLEQKERVANLLLGKINKEIENLKTEEEKQTELMVETIIANASYY